MTEAKKLEVSTSRREERYESNFMDMFGAQDSMTKMEEEYASSLSQYMEKGYAYILSPFLINGLIRAFRACF